MSKIKFAGFIALTTAAALALTGCSSSNPTNSPSATDINVTKDDAAAALLPAAYQSAGINVASDIPYAPMELFDENNNPTGFDYDLAQAIGAKLGVKIIFQDQAWDSIIPSLQAGTHDILLSSMTDNLERQKVLDFVDYFMAGSGIIVPKGNPKGIASYADLCGKTVAVENATSQADLINALNAGECKSNKATITSYPSETDAQTAIRAGKADAGVNDGQVAAYTAKTAGAGKYFDLVVANDAPADFTAALIGVGVLKKNADLTKAIQAAIQSLIDDGTYAKLLAKWNLTDFAVTEATINGTK